MVCTFRDRFQNKHRCLDRLCTLFVLSILLDFEHIYAVLSSTLVLCCTMVTTKRCCYGACMSNYRYAETDRMKHVFLIRLSKPHLDRANVERWANACRLEGYTVASIKKDNYTYPLTFMGDVVFTLNHVPYILSSSWLSIHGKWCTFASEYIMLVLSANDITVLHLCYLENNPSSNDISHIAVSCLVIIIILGNVWLLMALLSVDVLLCRAYMFAQL